MKKPCFIVVDGGDGSGKDTQARFIARYYMHQSKQVRLRSHPALDNWFGRCTKRFLEGSGRTSHFLAAIFYIFDVFRSLIKYYRHEDEVIIFVRYLMGVTYIPGVLMECAYNLFSRMLPASPYFYYIDVPASEALRRVVLRGGTLEMFESEKKLKKYRKRMLQIAYGKGWRIIDGNISPKRVWEQIKITLP